MPQKTTTKKTKPAVKKRPKKKTVRKITRKNNVTRSKKKNSLPTADVIGIILLTLSLMLAASILSYHPDDPPNGSSENIRNLLGPAGAYVADVVIHYTFGHWLALVLPLLIALFGLDLLRGQGLVYSGRSFWPITFASIIASGIIGWFRNIFQMGESLEANGLLGWALDKMLLGYLGSIGSAILLAALTIIYATLLLRIRWKSVFTSVGNFLALILHYLIIGVKKAIAIPGLLIEKFRKPEIVVSDKKKKNKTKKPVPSIEPELNPIEEAVSESPQLQIFASKEDKQSSAKKKEDIPEPDPSTYQLPSIDLLIEPDEILETDVDEKDLREQASQLEERLSEFGVKASVVAIHPGPVITRYDLKPAPGVKVSRINALSDDLALSMSANSLRIIAPIPGAGAVGVEVPNPQSKVVHLRDIIDSDSFRNAKGPLTIALGKTAQGEDFIVDLAKMPHVLIAGTTGSGKSVCINTIITSILMKNHPQEVMIAMVDPKKIELSAYAELRRHHLLFLEHNDEVIATEPKNAVALLQSVVREMEKRYDRLAETGARNLIEFNKLVEKGKVPPDDDGNEPKPLPYLVMIIDELADLMLTAAREVEEPIARLAQMARAVGIHLVVATQRPSVDVITGVIKANFPARIAFMVATKIDSRTILDRPGAESLLGRGDGLFLAGTSPQPVRFHGALVTTEEVHQLIAHVHNQPAFIKPCQLDMPDTASGSGSIGGIDDDRDKLFDEAVRIVARHQQGSVSLLQRRLKVGYSRAGRLLDQLEQANVVGPFEGSKAREVYLDPEQVDAFLAGDSE